MTEIYWCPFSRLYFRRPCSLLSALHTDVYVGDVLTADDLDSRELGYDLAAERYFRSRP